MLHLHLSRDEKISPQTAFSKTALHLVQTQGGHAEHPLLLGCQFPPNLALLLGEAESCAVGCCLMYSTTRNREAGDFHQAPSVFHMCFPVMLCMCMQSVPFAPAVPWGHGPQSEPQPLEGI